MIVTTSYRTTEWVFCMKLASAATVITDVIPETAIHRRVVASADGGFAVVASASGTDLGRDFFHAVISLE